MKGSNSSLSINPVNITSYLYCPPFKEFKSSSTSLISSSFNNSSKKFIIVLFIFFFLVKRF